MKRVFLFIVSLAIFCSISAQQFQTLMSGNITDMNIFAERPIGGGKWVSATTLPTGYLIINKNDTVIVNQDFSLDSIFVKAGGTLIVNSPLALLKDVRNLGGTVVDNNLINVSVSTAIEEVDIPGFFNIYASRGVIKLNVRTEGYLTVYNMEGQPRVAEYIAGEGGYEFPMQRLVDGIYIARFESGSIKTTKKFYFKR